MIPSGPETPDPAQLDLFGMEVKTAETVQNSTDSADLHLPSEIMIRSPTDEVVQVQPEIGRIFELNSSQQKLASSLFRKSRELASKPREIFDTENDLAR